MPRDTFFFIGCVIAAVAVFMLFRYQRNRPPAGSTLPTRRRQSGPASWLDFGSYGREVGMSLFAFAFLLLQFSWQSAIILAAVILLHEYGHLLAYQLTGRKGNRMMLVPFFGGIAVAGAPHKNEFERAFCALAGPGICAPLTVLAFGAWYWTDDPTLSSWAWRAFYFSAILNLFNLLPIYPLDGAHAAESLLRSFVPNRVRTGMIALSAAGLFAVAAMGYYQTFIIIAIFAFLSMSGIRDGVRLPRLGTHDAVLVTVGYGVLAAVHATGVYLFFNPPVFF
jgi:Zn-dependent protease